MSVVRGRRLRPGPLGIVTMVALLLAVIVSVVLLGGGSQETDSATAEAQCQVVDELAARRHDADPVTRGGSVLTVLGDSYAQGVGLPDPRTQSWPTAVGRILNRTTIVDAVGGTGFVDPGPCGSQDFPARIRDVLATHPDSVIVQGGLNDTTSDEQRVREGARVVLEGLRSVPTVVVVGPVATPLVGRAAAERVDAVLREVALAEKRPYISALDWQFPYLSDRQHPTVEGQRMFADRLASSLPAGAA